MKTITLILIIKLLLINLTNAQWKQTNGPNGPGYVNDIKISGTSIFTCFEKGGVYRSTNNGDSWTAINKGITNRHIKSIAISGNSIYAASLGGGVFKSVNNGDDWTEVNTNLTNLNIYAIAASGSAVVALTTGNVFLSTDNGTNWNSIKSGLTVNGGTIEFVGNTIYVVYGGCVLTTSDNGVTWNQISTIGRTSIAVKGSDIYIGTVYSIFKSSNNGVSWTEVKANTDIYSLKVIGNDIYASTEFNGLLKSSDNGATWQALKNSTAYGGMVTFAVNGSTIFLGSWGGWGIARTVNSGTSWEFKNVGFICTSISQLFCNENSVLANAGRLLKTTNGGSSWLSVSEASTQSISTVACKGDTILVSYYGNILYISTNFGTTWTSIQGGLGTKTINSLAIKGNTLIAGTSGGVCISTDNGANWITTSLTLYIQNVIVSGNTIYAVKDCKVYFSSDNGNTWSQSVNIVPYNAINSIAVAGTDIFAITNEVKKGVYKSSDHGVSWTTVNNGLTDLDIRTITAKDNFLIATTADNVFITTNNGTSWSSINNGLEGIPVLSVGVKKDTIFVGTSGNGVWKKAISQGSTFNVSFNVNGGSAIADVVANANSTIPAPIAPTKASYTFAGWYKDAAYSNAWIFDTDKITANTTLYAKWNIATKINSVEPITKLLFYPQPADDYIIIEGANFKYLSVIDFLGNKLSAEYRINENNARIDISNLKSGVYIIQAKLWNDKVQSIKFIKK